MHGFRFPREVFCYIDGRYGETERPARSVTFHHDLAIGGIEHIHLLLELAVSLVHHLSADDHSLVSQEGMRHNIQGNIGKRRLEAYPGGHVKIVNEALDRFLYLFVVKLVIVNERRQICIYAGNSLGSRRFPLQGKEQVCKLHEGGFKMFWRS